MIRCVFQVSDPWLITGHLTQLDLHFGSKCGSNMCVDASTCLVSPQVAIMTPDMATFQTVEEAGYGQGQDDIHPVTLLATSNGTHIAVQVGRTTP